MRSRSFFRGARWLAVAVACHLVSAAEAGATCCPFPCDGCWIQSQAQFNLVVMDRAGGRIDLIPNIRFTGNAADFALVVPTPTLPALDVAEKTIWDEASRLTAPQTFTRNGNDDMFGCGSRSLQPVLATATLTADGVTIHGQETLGGFLATIVTSDGPGALVTWLNGNGFVIAARDSARFAPYVARGWFFTAMRPDTSDPANRVPVGGWNADVRPVRFRYAAAEFEVPLPLITINQAAQLPLVFYVVDDHRAELSGFNTAYANRIDASEFAAISGQYPALAQHVSPGRFLTRLDGSAASGTAYDASVPLKRAPTDDEFRLSGSTRAFPVIPTGAVMIGTMAVWLRAYRPRRPPTSPPTTRPRTRAPRSGG